MVKDTLRPQFKKIKLAPRQMDISRFEHIIESLSSEPLYELVYDNNKTFPEIGPFVNGKPTSLLCVKLINSEGSYVYLNKVYYDYFIWINCTFAAPSKHDGAKPVAIIYKGEIVGCIMGIWTREESK